MRTNMKMMGHEMIGLRAALVVGCALASVEATGCAGMFDNLEMQDSVETSLAHHPTDRASIDAVPTFLTECSANDGGACSALGVAYELGIGHARDVRAAHDAYDHACALGNARGCANLAKLLAAGSLGDPNVAAAKSLFESACKGGDRSGCAQLGRLYRDGRGVAADAIHALTLFESACGAGEASACFDLAAIEAKTSPDRVLPLYVRSCVGGYQPACAKLDEQDRPGVEGHSVVATR